MDRRRPTLWQVLAPLVALAGLGAALVVGSRLIPGFYEGFVGPFIWRPIVEDSGFNLVNTLLLVVVLGLLCAWIYRLLQWYAIRVEIWLILAGLHIQPAGSMLRALEDSDYFAPFDQRVTAVRPDLGAGATCVPDVAGGILHECLGLFFITPIIYVWIALLVVGGGLLALEAQYVAARLGRQAGRQFLLLTILGIFALHMAWWASGPTYIRMAVPPWWLVICLAASCLIILAFERRLGRHDWRAAYLAYNTFFFLWVSFLVGAYVLGGTAAWRPEEPRAFIIPAGLLADLALVVVVVAAAVLLTKGQRRPLSVGATWIGVGIGAALVGAASFFALAYWLSLMDPNAPASVAGSTWAWPLASMTLVALLLATAYRVGRDAGGHSSISVLREPLNMLLLGSQFLDALMTSVGLDIYGATEKHVLPRTLVAAVDAVSWPAFLDPFPTMLAFIPFKLGLTLLLIWAVDVRFGDVFRAYPNLAQIVKGAALIVGLAPGLRDAIRLGMGV